MPLATALVVSLGLLAAAQAPAPPARVRVATFNGSLNRNAAGELVRDLSTPGDVQAQAVAEILQRVRPDIVLLNEFDFDPDGRAAALFQTNYLGKGQQGAEPITYEFRYSGPVNTGVASGRDLDGDGQANTEPGGRGYGNDALGYGQFPGQYGMVVYSKFPIDAAGVRDFRRLLWKDVPGATLPRKPDGSSFYSDTALAVLPVSSKAHWDVPITVGGRTLHLLASHPTPPAFDGPEDRNGLRNDAEIRLWADYLTGPPASNYLAEPGGGAPSAPETFVILGDQNADPIDGESVPGSIDRLLKHPRVNSTFVPRSDGGAEAARLQGKANTDQKADPATDTADFSDNRPGNLRVDYVLPSKDLTVHGGGIFWPTANDPLSRLVTMDPKAASSDHRLVYLDLEVPAPTQR